MGVANRVVVGLSSVVAVAVGVFEELRLREGKLAAVKPRPEYAPPIAYILWYDGVVGGTRSI